MKNLVTGGCGYKGSVLVPKLIAKGDDVVAFDIQWFGNFPSEHPALGRSDDPRPYRVNTDNSLTTGFRSTVADTINEIIGTSSKDALNDANHFHDLKWIQWSMAT